VNRTDRLYAMVEELRAVAPRTRTVGWLAGRFEVSTRTVERDLSALLQAGVPLWSTPGRGGGWGVDSSMTLPPVGFTAEEATAVALALARSGPMPFRPAAATALRKLLAAMSASDAARARQLSGRIRLIDTAGPADDRDRVLGVLEEAVRTRRVLRLDYTDRDGTRTERRVEPIGFVGGESRWYLDGWCRLRDGRRAFRTDRINAAGLTSETAPDRTFDPHDVPTVGLEALLE
jgi:predicted DNA-binding transcriptional regulator YafY